MAMILLDPEDFSSESSDMTILNFHDWIDLRENSKILLDNDKQITVKDRYVCHVIEICPPSNSTIRRLSFRGILSEKFDDLPIWVDKLKDRRRLISILNRQLRMENESFAAWLFRICTDQNLPLKKAHTNIEFAEAFYLLFKSLILGNCHRSWVTTLIDNLFSDKCDLVEGILDISDDKLNKIPENLWLLPFRRNVTQDELDFRRLFFSFLSADDLITKHIVIDPRKIRPVVNRMIEKLPAEASIRKVLDLYTGYCRKEELATVIKTLAVQHIGKAIPDQELHERLLVALGITWDDLEEKLREVSYDSLSSFEDSEKWFRDYFCVYRRERLSPSLERFSEFSQAFSEYIINNAFAILEDRQRSLLKVRDSIKLYASEGVKILVYVIDSCGGEWFEFMRSQFSRTNKVIESDLLFASLPTTTAINKTRILGEAQKKDESPQSTIARTYGVPKTSYMNSDNGALDSLLAEDSDLSVYWDLNLDRKIHSRSSGEINDYLEEIEIIHEISSKILEASKWFDGVIIILADHGHTVFKGNVVPYSEGEVDHGGRILITREESLYSSDDFLVFESEKSDEVSKYVISKSYDCFSSPRSRSVHGGASPEEVMIPFFIIDNKLPVIYSEPEVTIHCHDEPSRKKGVDVALQVENLSVDKVLIKRITGRRVLDGPESISIPPKKSAKVFVKLDLSDVEISRLEVEISITLIFQGRSFMKKRIFMLSTKGATTKSSFDDNFEF